jgi:two-component system sensor histidine kinase CiaH
MHKSKKIRLIFFTYWFLLLYIIAALVWWFIALTQQNEQMTAYKLEELKKTDVNYRVKFLQVEKERKRKTAQYTGEGAIFLLLTVTGAVFVYRTVNRELKLSSQEQHFIMAVTHELKTPIAVAKLNLETLQLRKLDETQQQRLLYNTLQETNRLNTLCNNMLISSQIEAGGYRITNEEINISDLVQNCVNDFAARFPKRVIQANSGNEIFVTGDMLLLQMAVNNLLDNAIKYSAKENKITVDIVLNKPDVEIQVKDEGTGINEKERKKIFEKYYRVGNDATKHSKGTGLGLYLTKKIIAEHHGRIYIKDNLPKGSIFVIELKRVV